MFLIKYDDGNCSGKGITGLFLNLQKSIHERSHFPFSLRERLGKWLESRFCIHLHQCIPMATLFRAHRHKGGSQEIVTEGTASGHGFWRQRAWFESQLLQLMVLQP